MDVLSLYVHGLVINVLKPNYFFVADLLIKLLLQMQSVGKSWLSS